MPPTRTTPTCSRRPAWSESTASTAQTTKSWPGWTKAERCTCITRDASLQVHMHHSHHGLFVLLLRRFNADLRLVSSSQPRMWGGPVREAWRLLGHLSAGERTQDQDLSLPLWIQLGQRWQVLQKWVWAIQSWNFSFCRTAATEGDSKTVFRKFSSCWTLKWPAKVLQSSFTKWLRAEKNND